MMYNNLLEVIGNTPLVKINLDDCPSCLYAKLEYLNPGGSVKDRSAVFMIEEAERLGLIKSGGTIIDASSGNHGTTLAMIGAVKGYKVIICVSEKISNEKLTTMLAYGAEVVVCPATKFVDDPLNYHNHAITLAKTIPNSFMPNQYFNISNAKAHYTILGPEIWKQTKGKITHFFAAAGTGGTISGVGKYLKKQNPNIKIIALDSDKSYRSTQGKPQAYKVEGMGIDFDTPVLDYSVIDDIIPISDDHAISTINLLAQKFGFLVGPSSGAVIYGAWHYAKKNLTDRDCAVMICADSGRAYLTKNFFETKRLSHLTEMKYRQSCCYKENI